MNERHLSDVPPEARAQEPEPGPPPPRQRAINAPAVIIVVIAVLAAIHAYRSFALSPEADLDFMIGYAFVPLRLTLWLDPDHLAQAVNAIVDALPADEARRQLAIARYIVADDEGRPYTLLTYALLHGDWTHLAINSASLLAFGAPLARRVGTLRTLLFLSLTALAGIGLHYVLHPDAVAPVIGASASASGVMAAAARFMFGPHGFSSVWAEHGPVRSVPEILRSRSAMLFIGVWMALNLIFGLGAAPLGIAPGGIAWEAHIGGFVAGFALMPWFDRRREALAE